MVEDLLKMAISNIDAVQCGRNLRVYSVYYLYHCLDCPLNQKASSSWLHK